jgi:hypothetical protein
MRFSGEMVQPMRFSGEMVQPMRFSPLWGLVLSILPKP